MKLFIFLCCFIFFLFSKTILTHNNETYQPNVISGTLKHSGYLWVWLKKDADFQKCFQLALDLQKYVSKVKGDQEGNNKILSGVGFGHHFYNHVVNKSLNFRYFNRTGSFGSLPNSGGDIFFHSKSNTISKLFELNQLITDILDPSPSSSNPSFSSSCLSKYEDIYSFIYKDNRDFTGFTDGTMNPFEKADRESVAINPKTGGTFCITQKWIHNLHVIRETKQSTLERFVGRSMAHSIELNPKSSCSHVSRVVGNISFNAPRTKRIVRQSQSYGTLKGPAGLFFIAFTNDTKIFDFMLDNMVDTSLHQESDCIMKLSTCVSGNYWYFPGTKEINDWKKK